MNINEVYIDLVYYTLIIHEINITWRSPLYKRIIQWFVGLHWKYFVSYLERISDNFFGIESSHCLIVFLRMAQILNSAKCFVISPQVWGIECLKICEILKKKRDFSK